jgi:hypothetical protein
MVSSHSFGSTPYHERPFGLAFAMAPPVIGLTWRQRVTRRPVLQKVRHHTVHRPRGTRHSALTVCKHMGSGSISFPSRGAFHLSLTVLVHYRSLGYLALGSGLPRFPTGSSCPLVLKHNTTVSLRFVYRAITCSGRPFHARSTTYEICNCMRLLPRL